MTPKEKAMELFNSYEYINKHINKFDTTFHSKMCALIAVDEIIQAVYNIDHRLTATYDKAGGFWWYEESRELKYWQEVKQEIEKL